MALPVFFLPGHKRRQFTDHERIEALIGLAVEVGTRASSAALQRVLPNTTDDSGSVAPWHSAIQKDANTFTSDLFWCEKRTKNYIDDKGLTEDDRTGDHCFEPNDLLTETSTYRYINGQWPYFSRMQGERPDSTWPTFQFQMIPTVLGEEREKNSSQQPYMLKPLRILEL